MASAWYQVNGNQRSIDSTPEPAVLDEVCVTHLTKVLRLGAKDAFVRDGSIEVLMRRPIDLDAIALDHTIDGADARFETRQLGMCQQADRTRNVDDPKPLTAEPFNDRLYRLVHFTHFTSDDRSAFSVLIVAATAPRIKDGVVKRAQKNGAVVGGPADREGGKNGSGLALPALLAG
jgi:hypothetical protein